MRGSLPTISQPHSFWKREVSLTNNFFVQISLYLSRSLAGSSAHPSAPRQPASSLRKELSPAACEQKSTSLRKDQDAESEEPSFSGNLLHILEAGLQVLHMIHTIRKNRAVSRVESCTKFSALFERHIFINLGKNI